MAKKNDAQELLQEENPQHQLSETNPNVPTKPMKPLSVVRKGVVRMGEVISAEHDKVRKGFMRGIVGIVLMFLLCLVAGGVAINALTSATVAHEARITKTEAELSRAQAQVNALQSEVKDLHRSWWSRLWN